MSDPTLDDIDDLGDPGVPGGAAPAEEAAPLPEEAGLDVAPGDDTAPGDGRTPSVEDILGDLERVTAERDEFLALAQTKQADLENLRKRMMKQQADEVARRSGSIIKSLLPVLDALDYGVAHGDESAKAIQSQLLGVLGTEGLERVGDPETPFDPEQHEAVSHEPGDESHQVVAEVLRAGYRWAGHLVRPAMVRVRG